jgi:SM-20-related protein
MFTASVDVSVDDDLLPETLKLSLSEAVSWMPMYFVNRWERFKSHELDMHWYYPVAYAEKPYEDDVEPKLDELDSALRPISECWAQIKATYAYSVRLYECMISANTFGTEGRVHQDILEEGKRSRHHIALVYCNRDWNIDWAGETLVFDDNNEIVAAVMPRPGRVMKISGDPVHVGRSVSRICPTDRRVLVFKYWSVD